MMKKSMSRSRIKASSIVLLGLWLAFICSPGFAQNPALSSPATQPVSNERKIFVRSTALLVRSAVVEEKLLKRPEFNQLGLMITRDESSADIILELHHDVLTKYVYSAIDAKTQKVLAGGKVSSLGGTVAGKVAKRFLKQVQQGRP